MALLQDGKFVAAGEEERFTWKKHDYVFPENAGKTSGQVFISHCTN